MTVQHAFLIEFFRDHPAMLAELVRAHLESGLPAFTAVRSSEADLTALPPEFRADLVLHFSFGGERVLVIILEIQLGRDDRKRFTWPAYAAVERARAGCPALLVVFTLSDEVAGWADQTIYDGLRGGVLLRPMVLGPRQVPLLTRRDQARAEPDLALLSLVVHASERVEVEAVEGALEGLPSLPPERSRLYSNLITAVLRDACRRGLLEKTMLETINEKYKDILQSLFIEGRDEGISEGVSKGKAESVLMVLKARGVPVDAEAEQRILTCTEPSRLDEWLVRAIRIARIDDLFAT